MDSSFSYPKLRWPLDVSAQDWEGQRVLIIRCPLGITRDPLVLVAAVGPVLSACDGSRSFQQIVDMFAPQGLNAALLENLLGTLDASFFLANARFFAAEREAREEFASASVREAALAGLGYPLQRDELQRLVEGYLVPRAEGVSDSEKRADLVGLVTPHIDYRRGGACYGATYPYLRDTSADTYIVIGTSHQYSKGIFHLSAKDFACPLARFRNDTAFVTKVATRFGVQRAFAEEMLHRREHSLELQLPFMGVIQSNAQIVPILVGSFHTMVAQHRTPEESSEYDDFVSALVEVISERRREGGRVCFIAGVDMAHVGRHFGDDQPLSPSRMEEIGQRDRLYLNALEAMSKEQLFDHIVEDQDKRRICGFPTMYTVLDTVERLSWKISCRVIRYDQAVNYQTDCAVTYAGLTMYEA
jgi:AmmeMemoRadiSam system protein B